MRENLTMMKPEVRQWLSWLKSLAPKLLGFSFVLFGLPFVLQLFAIRFASGHFSFLPLSCLLGAWMLGGLGFAYARLCGKEALKIVVYYSLLVLLVPGLLTVFCYQATRPSSSFHSWLGGGWGLLTMFWAIVLFCGIPGLAYPVMRGLKPLQFKVVHGRPGLFRKKPASEHRADMHAGDSFADVLASVVDNRSLGTTPERIL